MFLRAYVLGADGSDATGKLITNQDLGADGISAAPAPIDIEIGGMATWGS